MCDSLILSAVMVCLMIYLPDLSGHKYLLLCIWRLFGAEYLHISYCLLTILNDTLVYIREGHYFC
jgi:hypothetical protein